MHKRLAINMSFPRTKELCEHTPTFFAIHKERFLRQLLIKDIEEETGRRLLVFFSHPDQKPPIDSRDHEGFNELLADLNDPRDFDLVVESTGGDTDAADSIISTLLNVGSFRVIVPNQAKSNATLIALAAESVVMGPSSEIGPIEPIIDGVPATFYCKERFQNHDDIRYSLLYQKAMDARNHTAGLARSLLTKGMMSDAKEQIDKTVEIMCAYSDEELEHADTREFYSHAATINCEKARELGLKVDELDAGNGVYSKLRLLHAIYSQDCRTFKYGKIFETSRVSNLYKLEQKEGFP